MIYFTTDEYFHKMISLGYVPAQQTNENATDLLRIINGFITYLFEKELLPYDFEIVLNSGWRSVSYNESIGGAKLSKHITGNAVDIRGIEIVKLCEKDVSLLEKFNLYAESPIDTSGGGGWTHLQNLPPASKNRIFRA